MGLQGNTRTATEILGPAEIFFQISDVININW